MISAAKSWIRSRAAATLALIAPCLTGIVYLALAGAPFRFALINSAALTLAVLCAACLKLPQGKFGRRALALTLIGALLLPMLVGPSVDGITRWLAIGGFTLHVGMLVIPLLGVLAAHDHTAAPFIFVAALLVCFAQPDYASCLALACATFALWLVQRDWKLGAITALAIFASIGASFSGALPPQPFVEGILAGLWLSFPIAAVALIASVAACLLIIAIALPTSKAARYALCGAIFGFLLAAVSGDYPYPLFGYGAASIIGLGLALMRDSKQSTTPPYTLS